METIHIFTRRLIAIRERRRLTQQVLAERAGTSYQTIWRIERGRHKDVGIDLAVRLARVLGVTLDYLCGVNEDIDEACEPAETALVGA